MDKVSVSQPLDRGFEHHTGHDHDSSYDTSTGWFVPGSGLESDLKKVVRTYK